MPALYLLAKETSVARQLLRASAICSGLACLIRFKGAEYQTSLAITTGFTAMLAPEQTPFVTCLALVVNLGASLTGQQQSGSGETQMNFWPYALLQLGTIGLGGVFEASVSN